MFHLAATTIASTALWIVFVGMVYCMARHAPGGGIPLGHLAVAAIIYQSSLVWIRHEMSRPGWDGDPDMDLIFAIGLFARVGFAWAALLPVTIIGVWLKWRQARRVSRESSQTLGIAFL